MSAANTHLSRTHIHSYERGRFTDAVQEYTEAIECAEAGFKDDKRFRATLLSNRAACHRRRGAEGLPEALADCEAALCLLPKMARCLYRRSAILLEMGRPDDAIASLEALYRVQRSWPKLNEHLVRAHAAKRRNTTAKEREEANAAAAYDDGGADVEGVSEDSSDTDSDDYYEDSEDDEEQRERVLRRAKRRERNDAREAKRAEVRAAKKRAADMAREQRRKQRMADPSEAERIAKEQDHYVVLGVNADATEKQLKTAYRMMSLKYHPDRKGGSTAAFQRISVAYKILSDASTRRDYDHGADIKSRRGKNDSDSEGYESDEENKQTLREEIERKYFPERYEFWPFGDPFIQKRKREAKLRKQKGKKDPWYNDRF